ncbi:MAG: hypothetical protein IH598_14045 [Bacteroidales bacterium]|nr:hypothetical protein [Bacteroidales bacterium]
MEKEEKRLLISLRRAAILSGIGMGLLLGLIMGLSVSEVVKAIMATLTVALGAFLGFEKRSFTGMDNDTYKKDKNETLLTSLRAGWFGLAVVAGILFGMWIRTNEVFTIPVKKSVQQYIEAGYDSSDALKFVAYQRLGINPTTGEAGEIGEMQRAHQSNLFSAEDIESLCSEIDPDNWNDDWSVAKEKMLALDKSALTVLMSSIEMNVPESDRFDFLRGLRFLVCSMKMSNSKTALCNLGDDLSKWQENDMTSRLAVEVEKLPSVNQIKIMGSLSGLVCELEKD